MTSSVRSAQVCTMAEGSLQNVQQPAVTPVLCIIGVTVCSNTWGEQQRQIGLMHARSVQAASTLQGSYRYCLNPFRPLTRRLCG